MNKILMFRKLLTSALLLIIPCMAQGARYAGDAFSLGAGGRGLAMGSAIIAGPFDGSAAYWNPAGMNYLTGRSIIAMHAETFGALLNHDFVAYVDARPDRKGLIKSFGFYFYYLGGGGIKITSLGPNDRPYVVREESHGDYLLTASMSGVIAGRLDFGLTAKVIYRDLGTESGRGLTLDAGILYQAKSFLSLGMTVADITSGFIRYSGKTFDNGANYESIYPTVKPAFMLQSTTGDITGRLVASADIKFENIKTAAQYWSGPLSVDTHFGSEISYREILFGRFGWDIGRFTAGGGVDLRQITVDFAFLHHSELDETFRISAGYRF